MKNLYLEKILRSTENEGGSNGQPSSPSSQGSDVQASAPTTPRAQITPLNPVYNGQAPGAPVIDRPVLRPVNLAASQNSSGQGGGR